MRNALELLASPEHYISLRKCLNPIEVWQKVSAIRRNFPKTWRWILCSRQIQGWLSDAEANKLFDLARQHTPSHEAVVVELGSWKGKSSIMLAAGLLGKQDPRLFCVDPFGEDENLSYQERFYASLMPRKKSIESVFLTNVRRSGIGHLVTPIRGYSFEVCRQWKSKIDMLFLDANHEYASVLRDFNDWSPFVKEGGVIAFHDVISQWPGVMRTVSEHLVAPYYSSVQQIHSLAWATKLSD